MTSRKIILIVAAICIGGMALMGKKVLDNQVFAPTCAAKEVVIPVNPRQIAESITVKVLSGNGGGSGTLIDKKGQVYTVLTNQHVLTPGEPYRIQTPDGAVYSANAITNVNFGKNDLALLQFRADADYAVAVLAETQFQGNLAVNQEVFAAGFPFDSEKLTFNSGKISLLPDKALKDGYRIGYTNDIQKGMSGGPILNSRGEVIGINGVHAYPLFGDPYVFEDGSKPSDAQKQQMTRLSWGVPIQIVVLAVPQLAATNLVKNVERIAQEITVLITYPNGNGSGVIIAQRDNTYYVLTANHVVRDETQYEVTTPDGRCYPVNYGTVKKFEGVDLAVLEFKSDRSYRVATLGNYNLDKGDKWVFVSGWPGSKVASGKPSRLFTPGFILSKDRGSFQAKDSDSLTSGYELVYTNITAGGVSGGPVLDTRGRVIGIHGRAEGTSDETGQYPIQLGYSLGISMNTFFALSTKLEIEYRELKIDSSVSLSLTEQEEISIKEYLLPREVPKDSTDGIAWLNYGNQLWRLNRYQEAIKAFDRAIILKHDFYQAWYARGLVLMTQPIWKASPSWNFQKNKLRITINNKDREYQEAFESFDRATQIKSTFYQAWRLRGDALRQLNRNQEALESIDRAIELNPKDFALHWLRGEVLTTLRRNPEAIAAYNRSLEIKPHPWAYYNRGVTYLVQMGDYEKAIADFTEGIHLKPNYAEAYLNRGAAHIKMGNYEKAIADFTEALRLEPNDSKAYVNRGVVLALMRNYKGAIDDFNEALRLTPNDAEAYVSRSVARIGIEDYKGAISDCNEALGWKSDYPNAYFNRGVARVGMRDRQGAIDDLQKAAQLFQQQGDMIKYQVAQDNLKTLQQ